MLYKFIFNDDSRFVLFSNSHDDIKTTYKTIKYCYEKLNIYNYIHLGDFHDYPIFKNLKNIITKIEDPYINTLFSKDLIKITKKMSINFFKNKNDEQNFVQWIKNWIKFRTYMDKYSLKINLLLGNHDWAIINPSKKDMFSDILTEAGFPKTFINEIDRVYEANRNNLIHYVENGLDTYIGDKHFLLAHELTSYPKAYFNENNYLNKNNKDILNKLWAISNTSLSNEYTFNLWRDNVIKIINFLKTQSKHMQHYLTTIYPLIEFFKTAHDNSCNIDFSKFNLSFNVDNEILKIGNYFHLGIQQRNIFNYDYIVFGHYHKAINVLFNNGQKYTRFLSPGSLASKYNDTRMVWDNFGPVMIIDTSKEIYTHDKYIIAKLAKKFSYQNPAADFMDSLNDNARKILGY